MTLARKKGVLACPQFLFLRPIDRVLWYALNQCGGRTAWIEAAAAWSHWQAEKKSGRAIPEPQIARAVAALEKNLAEQGWLTDTPPVSPEKKNDPEDLDIQKLLVELV